MTQTYIVTDSTADIPTEFQEELGIIIVPLKVHFNDKVYLDIVELHGNDFYEKLKQVTQLPTTSQPSPADFIEVYHQILRKEPTAQILSIHLSSSMSGTYQSALLAKSMLQEDAKVTVIDSKSASYGLGLLAVAASQLIKQGKSMEETIKTVLEMREKSKLYFLVDTLEYLLKGGRIGKASAALGSLLNIKPILSIDKDGEVFSSEKIRGHKKAMIRIVELLKSTFKDDPVNVAIGYGQDPEGARIFRDLIQENFNVASFRYITIGSVIGSHVGPGILAVFMSPYIGE